MRIEFNIATGVRTEVDDTQDVSAAQAHAYSFEGLMREWDLVRARRDAMLSECDWTQLPDSPVDAAAWASYRQALRDVGDQKDPYNIVWPVPPEAV